MYFSQRIINHSLVVMQYFMSKGKIWTKTMCTITTDLSEAGPQSACRSPSLMQSDSEREKMQRGCTDTQVFQPGQNVNFQKEIPKEIIFHNNFLNPNAAGMGVCFLSTCEPKAAHQALSYLSLQSNRPLHKAQRRNQYMLRVHCHTAFKFALI